MPLRYSLAYFFSIFLISVSATALPNVPAHQQLLQVQSLGKPVLSEQRYHYELAKRALDAEDLIKFHQYYALLGDYPLVPYLDYTQIKENLKNADFNRVNMFMASNRGSFLAARLREQLLYVLAQKHEWALFDQHYLEQEASTELRCYNLFGRIQRGELEALDKVASIWVTGRSLPKSCDPLFSVWKRAGKLDSKIAWERFTAALGKGRRGLASYIRRYLKGPHRDYAELMLLTHSSPYTIRKREKFLEQSPEMQQVIAHGIKRYARHNPKDALKQWELFEAQQLFPIEITAAVKMELAKRLTYKDHHALAENLIKSSREVQQSDVIEQQLRASLEMGDWTKLMSWLDLLDDNKQQTNRWLYWRARAQAELGILEGPYGHFVDIYARLAGFRSFYGFLAADKLGTEYALQAASEDVSPSTLTTVGNLPAMRRARELWLTDNRQEAQAEWVFAIQQMNAPELVAAGYLAKQWGWYNGGINAMISGSLWNHLSLRFPLAYQEEITRTASDLNLAPNLIYAVARQESAFSETARSSAGAMGLMQLMPNTARQTAKNKGVPYRRRDLFKPENNLQLGSHYLNQLLEKYQGNRILATAAYNAGPHRVNTWMKGKENLPFDVWIETIPFKETRGYVQNVLAYSVIYAHRLGQSGTFITEKEAN